MAYTQLTKTLLALVGMLVALGLGAAPAGASFTHLFEGTFCEPSGLGTPPCEPSFGGAYSLAVHEPDGDLIVLDVGVATLRRFKANGEPDPFSALGVNTIDGQGSGPVSCAPPSPECDGTPENGFTFPSGIQEAQIAVDSSGTATDGNIYVTQSSASGLHLVDVFDASGKYVGQLTGTAGGPFGATSYLTGVTVDGDGNVFVSDFKFTNINDSVIYKYVPAANPPANADGAVFSTVIADAGRLAAGVGPSDGKLFASDRFGPVVKLDSEGEIECKVHDGESIAVAVDPSSGNVLVSDRESGQEQISEYDATACSGGTPLTPIARFDGARKDIAVEETGGRVYATADVHVEVYGPLVPQAIATTGVTTGIGETTATVHGTVQPLGEELTECKFEYGTTTAYGSSKPCAESPAEIGSKGTVPVHADLTGLAPETLYHYRLVVANPNGPGDPQAEDATFQTVSKPQLVGVWSEDVTLSGATLKAQINPQSAATTYFFEWGLAGVPYEHTSATASIGAGAVPKTASLSLGGLTPGADYHYRLVASNECHPESAPGASCASESAELKFTTYLPISPDTACPNQALRTEASTFPPDCRAYEMVSPVDKNGGDIVRGSINPGVPDGFTQAAPDGESITYTSLSGFGDLESGGNFNQYLATRGGGGWGNQGIRPPLNGHQGVPDNGDHLTALRQFMAFTPDLCYGWLVDYQTPPLTLDGIDGYPNLYRRDNCPPGEGDLEALTDVEPPVGTAADYVDRFSVVGVSANGRHALFHAKASLVTGAPGGGVTNLYDRSEGAIHLVSVLTNGNPGPGGGKLGAGTGWQSSLATAVSEDGSRVYWKNGSGGKLLLRLNPELPQQSSGGKCPDPVRACTVAVSGGEGLFWAASADGSKAIYTQGPSGSAEAKLFEFDQARLEAGETASKLIAEGGVEGVAGASHDASRVYFVSRKALPGAGSNSEGQEASEGAPNLYLYDASAETPSYIFVATLSEKDVGAQEPGAETIPYDLVGTNPFHRATRVSGDGRTIAFNSRAPLTGYDNTDTASGKGAVEVYLYSAQGGELLCASCKPSRARPQTKAEMKVAYQFPWEDDRSTKAPVAAFLPTWEQPTYVSRPLSESGDRLFFNSYDALLPRDSNGELDVYEWEAAGEGSCDEGDADYFASNGGCLYLISSGESSYESEFWEASSDGEGVFFTTESSLVPPDPGSVDLYDARVGGGFSYSVAKASCEGEACQSPAPAPELGPPASSTYTGPANPGAKPKPRRCPKGKRKVRRAGKTRCVKKRHRKADHSGRATR